jgi:hypothetical protein
VVAEDGFLERLDDQFSRHRAGEMPTNNPSYHTPEVFERLRLEK